VFEHYRTRPLQRNLLRLTPWLAEAVTVLSGRVRLGFPPALAKHMIVVANPVTIPLNLRADAVGAVGARKRLLSVGRFTEEKNHGTLIRAFAALAADFPEWDLRIVGEGELRSQFESLIGELGVGDRVCLPGRSSCIGDEYLAAQLFVTPSIYESFGLVTAEALAYALPAIGFANCPGTNELIQHEQNGLLVAGSPTAEVLAKALAIAMRSPDLRGLWSSRGPASVACYSIGAVVARWEELCAKVTERASPG
jgi:glycosyltransferase involved in cell wall biosynthesis